MNPVKTKANLIQDIEILKGYLNVVSLDPNSNWGNNELMLFAKLNILSSQLNNIQTVIKRQYHYPKPIKLRRGVRLSILKHWKSMIRMLQACPDIKDLGDATEIATGDNYWAGEQREVIVRKFLVPRRTIGFLMGITPAKTKVSYHIAIPEPGSMKVQKSNYITLGDENAFTFNVTDEEKQLLKKAAINLFVGRFRKDNLKLVEKVNDVMKGW
jgi:hypothetical protein